MINLEDEPYSDQADATGYGSRYLLSNLGSIPIFLLIAIFTQLIFSLLSKILTSGKVKAFADQKRAEFWYGGLIDFFNENYLAASFAVLFNLSDMDLDTPSKIVNFTFWLVFAVPVLIGPLCLAIVVNLAWSETPMTLDDDLLEGGESQLSVIESQQEPNESQSEQSAKQEAEEEPREFTKVEKRYRTIDLRFLQDDFDRESIGSNYGSFVQQVSHIRDMNRCSAVFFIIINLYRRLLVAICIIGLYKSSVFQCMSVIYVNFFYTVYMANFTVYTNRLDGIIEGINEYIVLFTLYFLLILNDGFISDFSMFRELGFLYIGITGLNFVCNFGPILVGCLIQCKRDYVINKRKSESRKAAQAIIDAKEELRIQKKREALIRYCKKAALKEKEEKEEKEKREADEAIEVKARAIREKNE